MQLNLVPCVALRFLIHVVCIHMYLSNNTVSKCEYFGFCKNILLVRPCFLNMLNHIKLNNFFTFSPGKKRKTDYYNIYFIKFSRFREIWTSQKIHDSAHYLQRIANTINVTSCLKNMYFIYFRIYKMYSFCFYLNKTVLSHIHTHIHKGNQKRYISYKKKCQS